MVRAWGTSPTRSGISLWTSTPPRPQVPACSEASFCFLPYAPSVWQFFVPTSSMNMCASHLLCREHRPHHHRQDRTTKATAVCPALLSFLPCPVWPCSRVKMRLSHRGSRCIVCSGCMPALSVDLLSLRATVCFALKAELHRARAFV